MFRFLLLLLLAYLVFRVARNLWRMVVTNGQRTTPLNGTLQQQEPPVRRVWEGEVEEARFRDL